jgi:hypothetical protein
MKAESNMTRSVPLLKTPQDHEVDSSYQVSPMNVLATIASMVLNKNISGHVSAAPMDTANMSVEAIQIPSGSNK